MTEGKMSIGYDAMQEAWQSVKTVCAVAREVLERLKRGMGLPIASVIRWRPVEYDCPCSSDYTHVSQYCVLHVSWH